MPPKPDNTAAPTGLAAEIGKANRFDCIEQEMYLNLIRTHEQLTEPFDHLFKSHSISQPLYNILRILRGHHQQKQGAPVSGAGVCGLPIQRIAEQMLTREPDMTRLIDRLEKVGLVERHRCPDDRRVVLTVITDEGLSLLEALDKEVLAAHREQLAHMPADRVALLNELLYEVRQRESAEDPQSPDSGCDGTD